MAFMKTRTPGAFSAGRQRVEQNMQRQQHQAEPDRDAADVLDARASAAAEGDQADDEENRRHLRDVNDRIWTISVVPTLAPSMIASAGTRLTRPSAVEGARDQGGRGAAL